MEIDTARDRLISACASAQNQSIDDAAFWLIRALQDRDEEAGPGQCLSAHVAGSGEVYGCTKGSGHGGLHSDNEVASWT